jgi:hypothetical protein
MMAIGFAKAARPATTTTTKIVINIFKSAMKLFS